MLFTDRADAGRQLAQKLMQYKNNKQVVVLGLVRGGVVTAYEVAKALNVELDILVIRKIGAPMQPELAVGALTQTGEALLNKGLMMRLNVTQQDIAPIIQEERAELRRRLSLYRGTRPPLDLRNRIAVLVDDGMATGATMQAAIVTARMLGAKKMIVAVPVAPDDAVSMIRDEVDEVICLATPEPFFGVGGFYTHFAQVEDDEVVRLLKASNP